MSDDGINGTRAAEDHDMQSAVRVARRHLLAGIMEPPPHMVADITDWVLSVYAGVHWDAAQRELNALREVGTARDVASRVHEQ